jgi:hypothetical protein
MKTTWLLLLALLVSAPAGAPPVPRGILKLRVVPPPGQSVPREIAVRVRPTRQLQGLEDRPWEVTVSSPLHDGEWSGEVPAGRVDLRFQGAAVMPVYQWGVTVKAETTRDLGVVRLERGASISGWLRTVDEKIPTHSLQVSLEPESVGSTMTGPAGLAPRTLRTINLESTTRPWGFFRFDNVRPGRYVVRASDPGLPISRSEPIVIEGDRSVELPEPLWVTPQVELDVQAAPPLGPDRQPWSFILQPDRRLDEGETWRPMTGTGSSRGRWQVEGLPPGDYWLAVGLGADNAWHKEKVRLRLQSTPVRVGLSFIRVRGHLTWREGPLAAALDFDDDRGSASLRSDAQGRFSGYLPNEGPWEVAVSSEDLRFRLRLQDRIRAAKETSFAWLEIRIPDTALPVEVTDERGRSLSRTTVNVLGRIRNQVITDELGKLEIVGLKPGPQCLLAAADEFRRSEETPVVLQEGGATPPLRLVIPAKSWINGRILPRLGFASGAQVLAWPAGSAAGVPATFTDTDEDGRFGLYLPPGTRKVSLVVLPPGSALRMLDAELTRDRMLDVHVDTAGGTLVLEGLEDERDSKDTRDREPCDPAVREREALTMPRLLRRWADLQGTPQTPGHLVVPNVEPGPYTLCITETAPVLHRGVPPEGDARCVGGVLEAAGELALKLPSVSPLKPLAVSPMPGRP